MLDKRGIDHLSFGHEATYYLGVRHPILEFPLTVENLGDAFPRIGGLERWLNMTVYRCDGISWSRDAAIKYYRNKLGGGHLEEAFDQTVLDSIRSTMFVRNQETESGTIKEEVPLVDVVLYEAGISMLYSLAEYLRYINQRVESGTIVPLYADYPALENL